MTNSEYSRPASGDADPSLLEATPGIEPGYTVLQTQPAPLVSLLGCMTMGNRRGRRYGDAGISAANSWSGFQELNRRQEYDFTFRWADAACSKALRTVTQSLRTNIQFRGDGAPISRRASVKARNGKGSCSAQTHYQREWAQRRNSGWADLACIRIARTYRAWPSANGEPAIGVGTRRRLRQPSLLGRPARFALLGRNAVSTRSLSSAWHARDRHGATDLREPLVRPSRLPELPLSQRPQWSR
jgi:hypothetical protein